VQDSRGPSNQEFTRISLQESTVRLPEAVRDDTESESESELFGLSARQTSFKPVVQMGIYTLTKQLTSHFFPFDLLSIPEEHHLVFLAYVVEISSKSFSTSSTIFAAPKETHQFQN